MTTGPSADLMPSRRIFSLTWPAFWRLRASSAVCFWRFARGQRCPVDRRWVPRLFDSSLASSRPLSPEPAPVPGQLGGLVLDQPLATRPIASVCASLAIVLSVLVVWMSMF